MYTKCITLDHEALKDQEALYSLLVRNKIKNDMWQ